MELSAKTTYTDLIINRLDRKIYNELLSSGQIYQDQIYLIEDTEYDVFNKRVVNVSDPSADYDAVNLNYLTTNYYTQNESKNILNSAKIDKVYNGNKINDLYVNGSEYADGSGNVYLKNTGNWNISATGVDSSIVTLYDRKGYGWMFKINGEDWKDTGNMNKYPDFLSVSGEYSGSAVTISAWSWRYEDEFVRKSWLKSKLSSITSESTFEQVRSALVSLVEGLSATNDLTSQLEYPDIDDELL